MADTQQTTTCPVCGAGTAFRHDHRADNSGLDDGPEIQAQRKRPEPKPPEIAAAIRGRAWATRRAKYGEPGHG